MSWKFDDLIFKQPKRQISRKKKGGWGWEERPPETTVERLKREKESWELRKWADDLKKKGNK